MRGLVFFVDPTGKGHSVTGIFALTLFIRVYGASLLADADIVFVSGVLTAAISFVILRLTIVLLFPQGIKLIFANDLALGQIVGQLRYGIHIPFDDLQPGAMLIVGIVQGQEQVQLIIPEQLPPEAIPVVGFQSKGFGVFLYCKLIANLTELYVITLQSRIFLDVWIGRSVIELAIDHIVVYIEFRLGEL